jgi:hypothetical protein
MGKPILCLDFDGVIHSYSSGWKGADVIPDPPVDGAMKFIWDATEQFRVAIFSSRSNQPGGLAAMQAYVRSNFKTYWGTHATQADDKLSDLEWPKEKPAAFITIDDRALTFDGTWPAIELLKEFQPWNKRPLGATGTFPQGKVSDDDEGGLKMAIAFDPLDGIVRVEFGKPVAWLGLPPPEAMELGKLLMKHAGAKKIEVTI